MFRTFRDVPDQDLNKLATIAKIPDSERERFCWEISRDLANAKAVVAFSKTKNETVMKYAESLMLALQDINEDERAQIERALNAREADNAQIRLDPLLSGFHTQAVVRVNGVSRVDVFQIIRRIAESTRGAYWQEERRTKIFQDFVFNLLRAVYEAGGKPLAGKRLLNAIRLLQPYAPCVIPQVLPERTIKRVKAESEIARAEFEKMPLATRLAQRETAKYLIRVIEGDLPSVEPD
jgi:hypothetical protein